MADQFKQTAADIPPSIKPEYGRLQRASAVASADGDGYTKTKPMQKAQQPPGRPNQFGLPRTNKARPMKVRDTDKDKM